MRSMLLIFSLAILLSSGTAALSADAAVPGGRGEGVRSKHYHHSYRCKRGWKCGCPRGDICHPLYGAYGPWGGRGYWGGYSYYSDRW